MSKTRKTREAPNNIAAARKLFEKRTGQKFTQNDAALEFGVSLSTYRNYEQEHTLPNGGVAAAMANAFCRVYGIKKAPGLTPGLLLSVMNDCLNRKRRVGVIQLLAVLHSD